MTRESKTARVERWARVLDSINGRIAAARVEQQELAARVERGTLDPTSVEYEIEMHRAYIAHEAAIYEYNLVEHELSIVRNEPVLDPIDKIWIIDNTDTEPDALDIAVERLASR